MSVFGVDAILFFVKNLFASFTDSSEPNITKFTLRKLSKESELKLDNLSKEVNELEKEKIPPAWLSILSILSLFAGLIMVSAFLYRGKNDFENAYKTIGYLLYIGLILFVVGLGFLIYNKVKIKKSDSDPEVKEIVCKTDNAVKECRFELNIPETSNCMDVFFLAMKKNKNGEEVAGIFSYASYVNIELRAFLENDMFCLGANDAVVGVPLSSIKQIVKVKKRVPLVNWNKNEKLNSPKYKQFKMYFNSGYIWTRYYYEVDLDIENEEYCFFIPCFEKDNFINTIGIEVPVIEK